jgi:hypothetical protein
MPQNAMRMVVFQSPGGQATVYDYDNPIDQAWAFNGSGPSSPKTSKSTYLSTAFPSMTSPSGKKIGKQKEPCLTPSPRFFDWIAMNIQPFELKNVGKWVIAVNPSVVVPDEIGGVDPSLRSRNEAEGFWNPENVRWSPTHGKSVKYDSHEECQSAIEENYEQLSSTQILY